MTSLVGELLATASEGQALVAVPGIVTIDEIDQRMHPRWQLPVVTRLASELPSVQLIATSHSPLLAGSLRPGNLILMDPDPEAEGTGAMRARTMREDVFGMTVDRVLTSSWFELESSRSETFRKRLRELARAAREGDRDAPLELLRELAGQRTEGRSPRRKRRGKT